jgi:hypothetical protein
MWQTCDEGILMRSSAKRFLPSLGHKLPAVFVICLLLPGMILVSVFSSMGPLVFKTFPPCAPLCMISLESITKLSL